MQSIAKNSQCSAVCFTYPTKNLGVFWVDTFNQRQQIQICGHGLLATAHILKKRFKCVTTLSNNYMQTDIRYSNKQIWLGFESKPIKKVNSLKLLENCFIEPPCYSAVSGGEDGYWILEWPSNTNLKTLSPNFKKITQQTTRAIIATQISSHPDFDINLRYFAPQYGTNEDTATGSACIILANYWYKRTSRFQFKAQQLSEEGAVINCKLEQNKTWINGTIIVSSSKNLTLTLEQ